MSGGSRAEPVECRLLQLGLELAGHFPEPCSAQNGLAHAAQLVQEGVGEGQGVLGRQMLHRRDPRNERVQDAPGLAQPPQQIQGVRKSEVGDRLPGGGHKAVSHLLDSFERVVEAGALELGHEGRLLGRGQPPVHPVSPFGHRHSLGLGPLSQHGLDRVLGVAPQDGLVDGRGDRIAQEPVDRGLVHRRASRQDRGAGGGGKSQAAQLAVLTMRPQVGKSLSVTGGVTHQTESVQAVVDGTPSNALGGVLGIPVPPGAQRRVAEGAPRRIRGIHAPAGHVPSRNGDLVGDVVGDIVVEGRRRDVARQAAPHSPEDSLGGAVPEDRAGAAGAQADRGDSLESPPRPIRQSERLVEPLVELGRGAVGPRLGGHDLPQHGQGVARHTRAHVCRYRGEGLGGVEEHRDELGVDRRRRVDSCDEATHIEGHGRPRPSSHRGDDEHQGRSRGVGGGTGSGNRL